MLGAAQVAYQSGELIYNYTGGSGSPTLNSVGIGFWGASNQFQVYPTGICNAAAYFSSAVKPCTAYYLTSNITVAAGGSALLTSSAFSLTVDDANNALGNALVALFTNAFTNMSGRTLWVSVTYQLLWDNTVNVNEKAAYLIRAGNTDVHAYQASNETNVTINMNGAAIFSLNAGSHFGWYGFQNTVSPLDIVASRAITGFGGGAFRKTRIAIEILN